MHRFINSIIRLSLLLHVNLARGECQVVRRSAFQAVGGYDETITVGEDWDLFKRLSREVGRLNFASSLRVFHSTRRFRAYGYSKTVFLYLREGLWLTLFHRSLLNEWESVR